MKMLILLTIAIVMTSYASAMADCELNNVMAAQCNDEFQSGIQTCISMHPNPLDAGDLRRCEMYSRDVYKKCMAWVYHSTCDLTF
jgi:hypothetical protein